MLRLFVLRHAKSSWAQPGNSDFDRGLNARGAADLVTLAASMTANSHLPGHVYCSPAVRARLTLEGVMTAFSPKPQVEYVPQLYSGDGGSYLACLRHHKRAEPVMIVGHNPMCQATALTLAGDGDADALAAIAGKYPTGGLAVLDFEGNSWAGVKPHSGFLRAFTSPKAI